MNYFLDNKMNPKEALIQSIYHVLRLIGEEEEAPTAANWQARFVPVKPGTQLPRLRYTQLECLVASLFHQFTFLQEQARLTFYTLHLDHLFEVKKKGTTVAYVYGAATDPNQLSDALLDTLVSLHPESGIATRYFPLLPDPEWNALVDPSILVAASQRLPIRFHYKAVYYSIAKMVETLFGRDLTLIAGTKLDGCLRRAKDPSLPHRILLF